MEVLDEARRLMLDARGMLQQLTITLGGFKELQQNLGKIQEEATETLHKLHTLAEKYEKGVEIKILPHE